MSSYLPSIKNRFEYYQDLGEKALSQVDDEHLNWQPGDESNSLAITVKHISGNMLSRWTDFLTSDGEKEWRHRDNEFVDDLDTREKVMACWLSGWDCLFNALNVLTDEDLERTIYIRKEPHTVIEAINRQLAHYAYHVGQMVYLARMIAGPNWKSLSIPKGDSEAFNRSMMGK